MSRQPHTPKLPIHAVRNELLANLGTAPIVLTAPTGSGKSTEVPRMCPGRTLVVEPRRVACRGLAMRVAELEGCGLGTKVGYRVRDDDCSGDDTQILFVTPGVALRMAERLDRFDHIILDEFHERGMETDLLLALVAKQRPTRLLVMSATLEAQRLASHLDAHLIEASGRTFPIEVSYLGGRAALPTPEDLAPRILSAMASAKEAPGDILVFVPGRAEITRVEAALQGHPERPIVIPLHGGLGLKEQARVFEERSRRKVIVATNVAETSLTVPGIGVVIDSGLVRRTRYHQGRSYLALSAVASDSAEQRAGRAGRTGPGLCLRLWGEAAQLAPRTPPEIHREPLDSLVLAAQHWGHDLAQLPLLDPPKPAAKQDALTSLRALGAVDGEGALTDVGRELHGLPLEAPLGRLLIEARGRACLEDVIDLVAALSANRPILERAQPEGDPLGAGQCDVTATLHALRGLHDSAEPSACGVHRGAVADAQRIAARLRRAFGRQAGRQGGPPKHRFTARAEFAQAVMAADPRMAHVVRARKGKLSLANGGTEVAVARNSLLQRGPTPEAALVLGARGVGDAHLRTTLVATCVMPIEASWVVAAGLTRPRLDKTLQRRGKLLATVEHVYAKRVLAREEVVPEGALARTAIAQRLASGHMFKKQHPALLERWETLQLAHRVKPRMRSADVDLTELAELPPDLEACLTQQLEALGVDSGADLALIEPPDVLPPPLPDAVTEYLEAHFPVRISLGDALYRVEYDFSKRRATLLLMRGQRSTPPRRDFLPRLGGLDVFAEAGGRMHRVR